MQYPWKHNRPFNAYPEYIKKIFGGRVQKLSVNAGFTCPNRDGTKGSGGCTFCNNSSFKPTYCSPEKSIRKQIDLGIEFHQKRYKTNQYFAYFQSFTNTYAPLHTLQQKYEEALSHPKVTGLIIGTRPDCISDELLQYLSDLSKKYYISIEFGIESCLDKTLQKINRCHSFEDTKIAFEKSKLYGLHTGGHIIFGLPGESKTDMLEQVDLINQLKPNTIKFHQLQIIKGTKMAEDFIQKPTSFNLFSFEEYINFIVHYVEKLRPNIIIERFASESKPNQILNKAWNIRNDQILQKIEQELKNRDTWQGRLFRKNGHKPHHSS